MKYMALDLGDARIGIATSDIMGMIANGYETYRRVDPERDLRYIADLIQKVGAQTVVIGLPINMDGTKGERVEKSYAFGFALGQAAPTVKIDYQDERLTTITGERMLIEAGVRREKRKQVIDKIAATIILQTYLDMH